MEILVVVAILGIVLLTAFSALSAVNRTAASIEHTLVEMGGAGSAVQRIARDLEALYVTGAADYRPPAIGEDPDPYRIRCYEESESPPDFKRLEFAAFAHRPLAPSEIGIGPGALARVSYFVRRINDRFVLMRTDTPDLRAGFDPPPTPAASSSPTRR